jgi:hypothetical protein
MVPYKHYAAPEIEQVLLQQEDPATPPHECGAEESTLYRWKREFPEKLNTLAGSLEQLAKISKIYLYPVPSLQRIFNALKILVHPPPDFCCLAWAYFVSQSHLVCLG